MTVGTREQITVQPLLDLEEYGNRIVAGEMTKPYKPKAYSLTGMLKPLPIMEELARADVKHESERIMITVANRFAVRRQDLISKKRDRIFVTARQIGMYIIHTTFDGRMSLKAIGRMYKRDHATVIHAVKTVTNLMETSRAFSKQVESLIDLCYEQ